MALLDKIFGTKEVSDLFDFNRETIHKELSRVAEKLYDVRVDEGFKVLRTFLEKSMNLDILMLSEKKELTSEAYAYQRGKIDGARNLLIAVDQAIANSRKAMETKGKSKSSDNPAKRSYIRPRAVGQAGLID